MLKSKLFGREPHRKKSADPPVRQVGSISFLSHDHCYGIDELLTAACHPKARRVVLSTINDNHRSLVMDGTSHRQYVFDDLCNVPARFVGLEIRTVQSAWCFSMYHAGRAHGTLRSLSPHNPKLTPNIPTTLNVGWLMAASASA